MSSIEMIITARERDLGGFSVRRILPYPTHRMVGPFIFFDHMGPATFPEGQGMDVRPHPHINLATVTYLFEGKIEHRDSLGSDQLIEPGAINWMTSGKGIVHSERTPDDFRKSGGPINGIQCWVALPNEFEEIDPSFSHHSADALPELLRGKTKIKILLGKIFGLQSPVKVHSDLFYADVSLKKGDHFALPNDGRETAAYLVSGQLAAEDKKIQEQSMIVLKKNADLTIFAEEDTRLLLLGGSTVGPRFIYWNFVSSSQARIEEAKRAWQNGPGSSPRFPKINADHAEYIPLPTEASAGNQSSH